DSVEWQQRITEQSDQSIWFAISITNDLAEARQRAEAFRDLRTVGGVGGIGLLFPPDEARKLELLREARLRLDEPLAAALAPEAQTAQPAGQLINQLMLMRQLM